MSDLMMAKIFFGLMGCFGIFVTAWFLTSGHYVLAIVAAVCTSIEFWGAFRKEDTI